MPTDRDQLTQEEKEHLIKQFQKESQEIVVNCQPCCCSKKTCCCPNFLCGTWFTLDPGMSFMFLLSFLGIVMDVWDVYTDCEYFFKYENFQLVNNRGIYRNKMVSNVIFVFAISGIIKLIVTVFILFCCGNEKRYSIGYGTEETGYSTVQNNKYKFDLLKKYNTFTVYILEDCAENFLEYFYVEKYAIGGQAISYTMIIKVFFKILIYGFKFISVIGTMKKDLKRGIKYGCKYTGIWLKFIFWDLSFLFLSLSSFIRFCGTIYQDHYGKLDDHCVAVVDGRLMQTPFTNYPGQCMRIWEYFFIFSNFYPVLFFIGANRD